MDKKYSTMVAVVAIFAMMFAGTAVVFNDSDDSSAANTSVDYKFRLELNDGTHTLKEDLKVQTAATITKDNYITTLKAALDAGGYTYVITASGWLTSITKDGVTYESTGTWSTPGYTGFAVYYADGQSWLKTSNYSESNVFSIVLDEYKFTDPASDSYVKDAYDDYWTLLPEKKPVDFTDGKYHINLQLKSGDKTINTWLKEQSTTALSKDNYIAALKAALDAGGYTYVITASGWLTSITKDGVTYESTGTWSTPGYTGFAVYYADGQSWLKTSNYSESNVFSIVLDEYKFTDPASDSYVKDAYDDYWTLLPTSATNGYSSGGSGNNTMLYIGIGVVAVVAVLAVAFFVIKKH